MLSAQQRHSARTMDRQRSRLARLASLQYALAQAAFHEGRREDAIAHVQKAEHYQSLMELTH